MAQPKNEGNKSTKKADKDDIKTPSDDTPESLSLSLNPNNSSRLHISINSPDFNPKNTRLPVSISCVIDISGSMSTNATVKDANGKEESDGLCILDLVKHSVKTIINVLNENDYLSIVSFSSKANIVSKLMKMNKKNKEICIKNLEKLSPDGATNLWDGIYCGLEQLRKSKVNVGNSGVFVFTDGLPNITPPKGELAMLEKYIDTNKKLPGIINTYGFGYSLDSELLNKLSKKGNGHYGFIPDSSLMGTVFVNSISNLLCNIAKDVVLKVETNKDKYNLDVIGGHNIIETSWGVEIHLGNIAYQQNKDIIIQFSKNQNDDNTVDNDNDADMEDEGKVNNEPGKSSKMYEIDTKSLTYINMKTNKQEYASKVTEIKKPLNNEIHYTRLSSIDIIRECMESCKLKDYKDAQTSLKNQIKLIKKNKELLKNAFIKDLLKDLSGQVWEAISKEEWYSRWGKHYLLSLISAHLYQYNNNFKDAGVQHYGGKLFKKIKDIADDVFVKLPAPKPQEIDYSAWGGYAPVAQKKQKAKAAKPVNMNKYYNAYGGCFGELSKVKMVDGSWKYVGNVKKGDKIFNGDTIKCVLKIKCVTNKMKLVKIDNLYITEYHPIKINKQWVFPKNKGNTSVYQCDYVYNFVMENGGLINVNNYQCCTLGHGFIDNEIIKHDYLGTNKVINDLNKIDGWDNGFIQLNTNSFKRDLNTNIVNSIVV